MMTDLQLLDFEDAHPGSGGAKDRALYAAGIRPLDYYVRLRQLRRLPSSHESHPMLMHRLERLDATSWRITLGRRVQSSTRTMFSPVSGWYDHDAE